ncbi:uncharacterized protein LOC128681829 [Plodia interpunctella]|uniref:uncharacterized protein LOC128681829 n=1 Tax=Plodia interpunctella TaxID=58824 RepID=UPI00236795E1|nr:uncharacterized protein LOC128681829 [Plodia interpunctella]
MDLRLCVFLFLFSLGATGRPRSVIIPEELPSLLSVAYSNIPPIKKGTDSRLGFGYAFGNHADFQVVLELGPQTNTQNLTGTGFVAASNAKRQAPAPLSLKPNKSREKYLQSEAGKYLQGWAQKMKLPPSAGRPRPGEVPNLEDAVVELVRNSKGEFEIHQPKPGHLPQNVLDELKRLYGLKKQEAIQLGEKKRTADELKKITDDLSNVDLD